MPLTDTAVSLDLTNREIILIAELNLVHPVLAGFNAHFANSARLIKHDLLVALVHTGVAGERRHHTVVKMELH